MVEVSSLKYCCMNTRQSQSHLYYPRRHAKHIQTQKQWVHSIRAYVISGALGTASLRLPVVVAGADLLVAIRPGRHAEALGAALLAEEHAGLLVGGGGAPTGAAARAFCGISDRNDLALQVG